MNLTYFNQSLSNTLWLFRDECHINLAVRWIFVSSKTFQKSRSILQYKMDLDFGECFGRENPVLEQNFITLISIFGFFWKALLCS